MLENFPPYRLKGGGSWNTTDHSANSHVRPRDCEVLVLYVSLFSWRRAGDQVIRPASPQVRVSEYAHAAS